MKEFYKRKMDSHHRQWQTAFDANKPKAANYHMQEYLNYKDMYEQSLERVTDSV